MRVSHCSNCCGVTDHILLLFCGSELSRMPRIDDFDHFLTVGGDPFLKPFICVLAPGACFGVSVNIAAHQADFVHQQCTVWCLGPG